MYGNARRVFSEAISSSPSLPPPPPPPHITHQSPHFPPSFSSPHHQHAMTTTATTSAMPGGPVSLRSEPQPYLPPRQLDESYPYSNAHPPLPPQPEAYPYAAAQPAPPSLPAPDRQLSLAYTSSQQPPAPPSKSSTSASAHLPALKFLSNPDIQSDYSGATGEPLAAAAGPGPSTMSSSSSHGYAQGPNSYHNSQPSAYGAGYTSDLRTRSIPTSSLSPSFPTSQVQARKKQRIDASPSRPDYSRGGYDGERPTVPLPMAVVDQEQRASPLRQPQGSELGVEATAMTALDMDRVKPMASTGTPRAKRRLADPTQLPRPPRRSTQPLALVADRSPCADPTNQLPRRPPMGGRSSQASISSSCHRVFAAASQRQAKARCVRASRRGADAGGRRRHRAFGSGRGHACASRRRVRADHRVCVMPWLRSDRYT